MENLMMNMDDPFDFGSDDPLIEPVIATKKRKKVIGLDDLFDDHVKEQKKSAKKKSKGVKARRMYASDDDDDVTTETENKLTEVLQDFQKTINEVDGKEVALHELDREDVTLSWGLQVFGTQKNPSPLAVPELGGCMLFQHSGNNDLSSLVDHGSQMGESFLRGLLVNGWLSKLIINRGHLEEAIAKWTFNLLAYSSDESLMASACDFWCAILLGRKVDAPVIKSEWRPGFQELKRALESYGFQLHPPTNKLPEVESPQDGSDCKGPPANIRAWVRFANACCQVRSKYPVFSTLEAEELVGTIVYLFLERQLLGITLALCECLISAINFFEDDEWAGCCENVAKSLADRVPWDLNCLRIVECITGVDIRSKQLRSTVAYQILRSCFDEEMSDAEDVLKFLMSINLKNKSCDLFKMYIYLVLTENWLLCDTEANHMDNELWNNFLWRCSNQISNTDFRPCAQEIRSRAAYLHQSTGSK